jgi:hypothetical protein
MKEFSVERGIEVQTRQLEGWKKLLKPKVYQALRDYATSKNDTAKDGYDILRGTDLTTFLSDYRQLNSRNLCKKT